MDLALYLLVTLITLGAVSVSTLSLVAAIGFLRKLDFPRTDGDASATLILPLTGDAHDLARLIAALAAQMLKPRRLLIIIETVTDPAYSQALKVARESDLAIEVILAGKARHCAQKNFNQLAGLSRIGDKDDVVVFLDADILPPRWWLATLVAPLLDGTGDVVTGYRWPVIAEPTLGAHLIAAIDRPIAVLPRVPGWARMVWGGSVALSRSSLGVLDLAGSLATALSDDCVIGERVAANGLRIITRRSLLLPTPVKSSLLAAWRFGRRQYQILGLYRPQMHWLSLAAITTRLAAWIIIGINIGTSWWPVAVAVLLLSLALASHVVRLVIADRLGLADGTTALLGQTLLVMGQPAVDLAHWSMAVAGLARHHVRWGHITYKVSSPHDIEVAVRYR